MSQCKHTGICRYLFFIIDFNCSQMTVFDAKICHLCFKAKRTSHLFNLMTHRFNNANQYVRSKMRFLLINDFLRCACLYKTFQNLMVTSIRIFYQCVKLSI